MIFIIFDFYIHAASYIRGKRTYEKKKNNAKVFLQNGLPSEQPLQKDRRILRRTYKQSAKIVFTSDLIDNGNGEITLAASEQAPSARRAADEQTANVVFTSDFVENGYGEITLVATPEQAPSARRTADE